MGCKSFEQKRIAFAEEYFKTRNDISEDIRKSILDGKSLLNMFPDEAVAASGPFVYQINANGRNMMSYADIRHYFEYAKSKPEQPRMPPDILWKQRLAPDNYKIRLNFNNKTQFDTEEPTAFSVFFENGKAIKIEMMKDSSDNN